MNLNEYQGLAMRTSPDDGHDRLKNGLLGLIGESGEIVDVVKKWKFQSGKNAPIPKDSFIKEIGDVLWYLAETTTGVGEQLANMLMPDGKIVCLDIDDDIESVAVIMAQTASMLYTMAYNMKTDSYMRQMLREIFGMLVCLCNLVGTTLAEVADTNITKLKARYPDGFDPERSIHRPEYEHSHCSDGGGTTAFLFEKRNKTE